MDSLGYASDLEIGTMVRRAWRGDLPGVAGSDVTVYIALRSKGTKLAESWATHPELNSAIRQAMRRAKTGDARFRAPDHIELCVIYAREPIPWDNIQRAFKNIDRGVVGIELQYRDEILRVAPTQMVASNRTFLKVIEEFATKHGLDRPAASETVTVHKLLAHQYLIPVDDARPPVRMFRGNVPVSLEEVTKTSVAELAQRMSNWMFANLGSDGRMVYKYWPSRGAESNADNTIRQWMATVCLGRIARYYADETLMDRAADNIRANIQNYYTDRDGLGSIEFGDSSKLGAIALAALAMSEHRDCADFSAEESALNKTVEHLWQEDGSFRTFLLPADRNDNQNFYPGEALLYLAHKSVATKDKALAERIFKSARYYGNWHLANRNPAFVPWHAMAYAKLLERYKSQEMANWVFEMNDWLLPIQQQAPDSHPDIDGRFYDPKRSHFGPPHASSTGVYLEGLIAAYRLATAQGQTDRANAYRKAIIRGLRSLMQLEFRDEVDMFYISKRDKVQGGLRTTVYNNEIRVDNAQHGLMAILQILREFEEGDYGIG